MASFKLAWKEFYRSWRISAYRTGLAADFRHQRVLLRLAQAAGHLSGDSAMLRSYSLAEFGSPPREWGQPGDRGTAGQRDGFTPIIRGLGWNTSDPKECHPEYPRSYQNGRRVDYALFGTPDVQAIGNNSVPPDVIIESKPLRAELDEAVPQLRRYAQTSPRMQSGVAVLTSGDLWGIYDLSLRGAFTGKLVAEVNILTDDPEAAAQVLHQWLGRPRFG